MNDREQIEALRHGEREQVNMADEGGSEVHRLHDVFVLFEIPQYGGDSRYVDTYSCDDIDRMLSVIYSFT